MKVTATILKKYAKQQCSDEENKIVEQWINNNHFKDKEEILISLPEENKLWANIKNAAGIETKKENHIFKKVSTWATAACIALLIGVGSFQTFFNTTTYQTLAGQTQTIILEDGSIVHLNAHSTLTISKGFSKKNRFVQFVGEGYFEVQKDSLHPFIIETTTSKTTVLGTKFNLSAYPNENNVVTLDEGKVAFSNVNNPKNKLIILPKEQGILNKTALFKNQVSNTKYYKGWLTNKLYFNNESLLTISHKIERTYGVKINITTPKLKEQTYKGAYSAPALKILLEDLSFVLKFNYTVKGKEITIY